MLNPVTRSGTHHKAGKTHHNNVNMTAPEQVLPTHGHHSAETAEEFLPGVAEVDEEIAPEQPPPNNSPVQQITMAVSAR